MAWTYTKGNKRFQCNLQWALPFLLSHMVNKKTSPECIGLWHHALAPHPVVDATVWKYLPHDGLNLELPLRAMINLNGLKSSDNWHSPLKTNNLEHDDSGGACSDTAGVPEAVESQVLEVDMILCPLRLRIAQVCAIDTVSKGSVEHDRAVFQLFWFRDLARSAFELWPPESVWEQTHLRSTLQFQLAINTSRGLHPMWKVPGHRPWKKSETSGSPVALLNGSFQALAFCQDIPPLWVILFCWTGRTTSFWSE